MLCREETLEEVPLRVKEKGTPIPSGTRVSNARSRAEGGAG